MPRNNKNLSFNNPIIDPHSQIDEESVRKALHKMKKGRAFRTPGVVSGMLLAFGDVGMEQMTNFFKIIAEDKVPEDWDASVIVNSFENKGGVTE